MKKEKKREIMRIILPPEIIQQTPGQAREIKTLRKKTRAKLFIIIVARMIISQEPIPNPRKIQKTSFGLANLNVNN